MGGGGAVPAESVMWNELWNSDQLCERDSFVQLHMERHQELLVGKYYYPQKYVCTSVMHNTVLHKNTWAIYSVY